MGAWLLGVGINLVRQCCCCPMSEVLFCSTCRWCIASSLHSTLSCKHSQLHMGCQYYCSAVLVCSRTAKRASSPLVSIAVVALIASASSSWLHLYILLAGGEYPHQSGNGEAAGHSTNKNTPAGSSPAQQQLAGQGGALQGQQPTCSIAPAADMHHAVVLG